MRPRIFSFIVCSLLFAGICHEAEAQDLGSKEESPIDVSGFDVVPTDPYRLTYRIRPMSILLFPITQGRLGSFNSRLDYAFHRRVSVGIELNYFYARPWQTSQTRTDMFSVRIDPTFYLFDRNNEKRYAEGFHLGGYYKYKYDDTFDPGLISQFGQSRVVSNSHILGGMLGFQYVKNRLVIDQSIGLGLGLCLGSAGAFLIPDFRLGLSFGTVLLQ
ncbi:MAG: hypothetical protein KC456_09865 [Flavobacteriales bacterium]|jgi:hypothetical protein|nr:hypothetical protein [Flavobacteriales bacterium]